MTTTTTYGKRADSDGSEPALEALLTSARRAIEVTDEELTVAKARRAAIEAALRDAFPSSRIYYNGSVAHGDALTPLTDVDLGVVVPNPDGHYGPNGAGPRDLMDLAAEAIRSGLKAEYEDLAVEVEGRRRSVLVRFRDPVLPDYPDFTADVIVAVDYPNGAGLHIPCLTSWDRAHPERHTGLVHAAIDATDVAFAQVVRLLKHWNKKHSKPLHSWNIKALALAVITGPCSQLEALTTWFDHAIEALEDGQTKDPAGVAPAPIKLRLHKGEVLKRLRAAQSYLRSASEFEVAGFPLQAQEQLSIWLGDADILPRPDVSALANEMVPSEGKRRANVGVAVSAPATPSLSWGP